MISEAASSGESGYIAYSYASPSVVGDLQTDIAGIYLGSITVEDWLAELQELKEKDAKDGLLYKLENY